MYSPLLVYRSPDGYWLDCSMLNENTDQCLLLLLETNNIRSFHRSGDLLNPLFGSPWCKTMSVEIFQSWQQINIQEGRGRAELTGELLPWSSGEDNVVWHAFLIWTALTQDALSHTRGKCKSVLITWVSQTQRARERKGNVMLSQQTYTPSDLHYRRGTGWTTRYSTRLPSLCCCSNLTCLVAVRLWYDNTHLVIHIHLPVCFIELPPQTTQFYSDLSGGKRRREVPLGTFLSHLSCLKNCCTWLAS